MEIKLIDLHLFSEFLKWCDDDCHGSRSGPDHQVSEAGYRICKNKVGLLFLFLWTNQVMFRAQMAVLKKGLVDEQEKGSSLSDQV